MTNLWVRFLLKMKHYIVGQKLTHLFILLVVLQLKRPLKKCVLSSGIIDSLDFNDIEVVSKSNGAPIVTKINKISYSELQISISHEKDYAIAMAMVLL